jgi:thymidine phosphorylase
VVHAAGIDLHKKPGDAVRAGEPLFTLHADDPARFDRALESLEGAYSIAPAGTELPERPLIRTRLA